MQATFPNGITDNPATFLNAITGNAAYAYSNGIKANAAAFPYGIAAIFLN